MWPKTARFFLWFLPFHLRPQPGKTPAQPVTPPEGGEEAVIQTAPELQTRRPGYRPAQRPPGLGLRASKTPPTAGPGVRPAASRPGLAAPDLAKILLDALLSPC